MNVAGKPIAIVEAPSNLGLKPPSPGREPGTARAPAALRRAGLHELVSPTRVVRVEAPAYAADENRAVNVRNVAAIADYSRKLADAVGGVSCTGRIPARARRRLQHPSRQHARPQAARRTGAHLHRRAHGFLSSRTIHKRRGRGHGPRLRHRLGARCPDQYRRAHALCARGTGGGSRQP